MAKSTGTTEIIINSQNIREQAEKLRSLVRYVESQNMNMRISISQGSVSMELNEIINSYNALGDALSRLFKQTAVNVDKIADEFESKDQAIAAAVKKL